MKQLQAKLRQLDLRPQVDLVQNLDEACVVDGGALGAHGQCQLLKPLAGDRADKQEVAKVVEAIKDVVGSGTRPAPTLQRIVCRLDGEQRVHGADRRRAGHARGLGAPALRRGRHGSSELALPRPASFGLSPDRSAA